MSIKKLGLALAVSALASGANAALYTAQDDSGNTGGSSLLLAAYDAVTTTTLFVDLNALAPNNRVHTFDQNANQTFDVSAIAAANNFSLANVQWTVVAGETAFAGGGCVGATPVFSDCGGHYLATVSNNETLPTTATQNSINSTISGVDAGWFLQVRGDINSSSNGSATRTDGTFGQWTDGLNPAQLFWNVTGTTGETLAFAMANTTSSTIRRGNPDVDPNGTFSTLAGSWTLYGNGTLNYAVAAIPVPAALWMFASGLVGLAGVARRRKQA